MGILSSLFPTEKVVEKVFDTAGKLADEAFYTKEEESKDRQAATTEGRQYLIRWLEATSPSRLARRVIAFATTFTWLGLYLFATVLNFFTIWSGKLKVQLVESADQIDARADEMLPVVGLVYGFYYAAPHIGELSKGLLARFTETK